MSSLHLQTLLTQLGIMLIAAWSLGYLARRLGQPAVMGELLGGILLGPSLLGNFAPAVHGLIFSSDKIVHTSLDAVLKVGMLFFMFAAGLEVNLVHVRHHGRAIASTSLLSGAIPFALGYGLVVYLPGLWGSPQQPELLALFMGTALTISALPVIARLLMETRLIHTKMGITVMGSAMLNDIVGWSLLAMILHELSPELPRESFTRTFGLVLGYSALVLGLGRYVAQPLLHRVEYFKEWPGGLLTLLAALVVIASVGAEKIGINGIFGAFLVGVAFGQDQDPEQENRIHGMIQPFALNFFAPIYFVSVGLKADFPGQFDLALTLAIFLCASLGKLLGAGVGALLGGLTKREALIVGIGLNARGAIEIILATVALEHQLIDLRIFVGLVAMAFATTLISGPILQRLAKEARFLP